MAARTVFAVRQSRSSLHRYDGKDLADPGSWGGPKFGIQSCTALKDHDKIAHPWPHVPDWGTVTVAWCKTDSSDIPDPWIGLMLRTRTQHAR